MGGRRRRRARARSVVDSTACRPRSARLPDGGEEQPPYRHFVLTLVVLGFLVLALCLLAASLVSCAVTLLELVADASFPEP